MSKKKKIKKLKKLVNEMNYMINDFQIEIKYLEQDNKYMSGFISYNNLNEAYEYFRVNAHEERDENVPFTRLTL